MSRWPMALAALLVVSMAPARAHHSLSDYDTGRETTLDGVIAQFQFVNPHPYVVLDVRDARGAVQSWHLEMDNRRELSDIGMTKDTLKAGDRIVVSGSPGHTQPRILYIRTLERPADGYAFAQVGNRPHLRRRSR
jgi:hypothetical protein